MVSSLRGAGIEPAHLGLREKALDGAGHAAGVVGGGAADALGHVHAVPALLAGQAVVLRTVEVLPLSGRFCQLQVLPAAARRTTPFPRQLHPFAPSYVTFPSPMPNTFLFQTLPAAAAHRLPPPPLSNTARKNKILLQPQNMSWYTQAVRQQSQSTLS